MGSEEPEHPAKPSGNQYINKHHGTESGTVGPPRVSEPLLDASADRATLQDLAQVVEAWPNLPPAVRAGIVAMVKAVKPG